MTGTSKYSRSTRDRRPESAADGKIISIESIAAALKRLRFKKSLFGVNERDAWVKIRKLDEMYRTLYQRREIEYRVLLEERDEMLKKYQEPYDA